MMTTIREIFHEFAPEYLKRFGGSMPCEHKKVIDAILKCRTADCGMCVYRCEDCGEQHYKYRSCGNRHCSTCQHQKAFQWIEKQMERQVPGPHFMITFTVPEQLRRFIRSNQRVAYSALFKASSESIKKLALDETHAGGDVPGFFGVLHTWGRQIQYHPHIHYVVPGGAFSTVDSKWHVSGEKFFMPVKALSKIFKAKFKDAMKKAELIDLMPNEAWEVSWNVNIQAVGSAENSIRYLGPYVFKVAISDYRITDVQNGNVTFTYKKPKSSRTRHLTLDAMEFMRRFLQHVLPSGFMKVRHYGFMSPNSSISLEHVRGLIALEHEFEVQAPQENVENEPEALKCPDCGGNLKYCYSILPYQMTPPKDKEQEAALNTS